MGSPSLLSASLESRRRYREAVDAYELERYERAYFGFRALLNKGTAQEKRLAQAYLQRPALQRVSQNARAGQTLRQATQFFQDKNYALARPGFQYVSAKGNPAQRKIALKYLEKLKALRIVEDPFQSDAEGYERADTAPHFIRDLSGSGFVQNEAAARLKKPRDLSKYRFVSEAAVTSKMSESLSFMASGRAYYDAVFALTDRYPRSVAQDERIDLQLRDTYLDYSKQNWDFRLGKQQIVWGETVGLFFADVVNARDLREFVLPEFNFIRIPEWAMNVEYNHSGFYAQGIWLPALEFDKVGRPGSEFEFRKPKIPGFATTVASEQKPANTFENSEWGGRLAYRADGWDLGLFHFRTWDKFPVYESRLEPGLLVLTPTHPRLSIEGATLAKEINGVVYKAETVYYRKERFESTRPGVPLGLQTKDRIDYVLAADFTVLEKISTTLQWSQRIIPDYEPGLYLQRKVRSTATLWLKIPFFENRLEPEFLWVQDLDSKDAMLRPQLNYKIGSHWRAKVGFDFFSGPAESVFGEFAAQDRAYAELRYYF